MTTGHEHRAVAFPPITTSGDPVDMTAFGALIGAGRDGCLPCQTTLIVQVVDGDPRVVAHAVAMTWLVEQRAGEATVGTGRSVASLPVPAQRIVEAIGGDDPAVWEAPAAALSPEERRVALDYALDLLIGMLTIGAAVTSSDTRDM
jgi:hypothetical protein